MHQMLSSNLGTSEDRIVKETKAGLEQERYFQVDWWRLAFHVLWRNEPMGPQGSPELEPLATWVEGTEPGQWPLPAGSRIRVQEASTLSVCWAFCIFLWRRLRPWGPAMLMAVLGLLPSMVAFVSGRIVGLIEDPVAEPEERQRHRYAMAPYLFGYAVLSQISIRLFYKFEVDVPEASVRHHLRHVVMRSLLQLRGDAASRFPPGESTAALVSCVQDAIDLVWASLFSSISRFTLLLSTLAVAVWDGGEAHPMILGSIVTLCLAMPLAGVLIFHLRLGPCKELAMRQTKWNMNMFGLAVEQVQRFRTAGTAATEKEIRQAAQDFADTAFVYRKRGFHSYFMDLVMQDTASEISILLFVAVCMLAGSEVLEGRLQVQNFVVIFTAVSSLRQGLRDLASILVGLPHGHAALLILADIINSDVEAQGITGVLESDYSDGHDSE